VRPPYVHHLLELSGAARSNKRVYLKDPPDRFSGDRARIVDEDVLLARIRKGRAMACAVL